MNPLTYIRRKVAEAVAQGFADGIVAATQDAEDGDEIDLKALIQQSMPKSLPAAEEQEQPAKKSKGK